MKSTHLIIRSKKINTLVRINDQRVYPKKDKNHVQVYEIKSEVESCKIKIYSLKSEFSEPHWWLFAILFYIISIFGIFNVPYSEQYYHFEYEGNLDLNQDVIDLEIRPGTKEEAILCLKGQFQNNETNHHIDEPLAKKRHKLYFIIKLISWILIVIGIILYILLRK